MNLADITFVSCLKIVISLAILYFSITSFKRSFDRMKEREKKVEKSEE